MKRRILGWTTGTDIADLIQEQRTVVGDLHDAGFGGTGVGEGALFVTEQLALDQRVRDRGAVQRHERCAGAEAVLEDEIGDQFLSGTAVTLDEDRGFGRGHLGGDLEDLLEGLAVADHFLGSPEPVELVLHQEVVDHQLPAFDGAVDGRQELVGRGRLGDEIVCPQAHAFHSGLDVRRAR